MAARRLADGDRTRDGYRRTSYRTWTDDRGDSGYYQPDRDRERRRGYAHNRERRDDVAHGRRARLAIIPDRALPPVGERRTAATQVVCLRRRAAGRLDIARPHVQFYPVLEFGPYGSALQILGVCSIPIAVAIAILRYRLYDIDILINRTLVYGLLTATLVAVYFGGIVLLQRLFVAFTGEKSTLAVVASILVIAAVFSPLRSRVQAFVDRRFYRRKYDVRKTLETFLAKLRQETDLEALNEELVGIVEETLQPAHAGLWLQSDPPEAKGQGDR